MIYLYGLLEHDAACALPGCTFDRGVTGPVAATPIGSGILLHGPAPDGELLPKRRHMLAHARVLESAGDIGALLPMRFGMVAAGVDAVDRMLMCRAEDVAAQFDRIRGKVELGLRVDLPREAALAATLDKSPQLRAERDRLARRKPAPHFETAEFGRRLAEALDRRRAATQKGLLARIAPLTCGHVVNAPEEDVQVLNIDVLVSAETQSDVVAAVDAAAREVDFAGDAEHTLRVIGPVPPFNFVSLSLSSRQEAVA